MPLLYADDIYAITPEHYADDALLAMLLPCLLHASNTLRYAAARHDTPMPLRFDDARRFDMLPCFHVYAMMPLLLPCRCRCCAAHAAATRITPPRQLAASHAAGLRRCHAAAADA